MRKSTPAVGRIRGYGMALASVAVAFWLTYSTWPLLKPTPWAFCFVAVLASGWYGGLGPGLVATAAMGLLGQYFFIEPYGTLVKVPAGLIPVAVFITVSLLINLLASSRQRAEAFERAERRRFQATVTSIGDAVIATDRAGRVTFMNVVAEELTAWRLAEAKGRPLEEVFVIINEGTRQTTPNPVAKVLETGKVQGLANHTVLIARGGAERPIDDSAAPIRDDRGQLSGVVLVFHDVSAQREAANALAESEDYSRRIIESSADCLKVVDLDGRLQLMNQNGCRLMEIDDFAPFIGQTWSELWPAESRPLAVDALDTARAGEVAHFEGPCPTAKGTMKWWDVAVSPVLDAGGKVVRFLSVSRDVTARKDAELALRAANDRSEIVAKATNDAVWDWDLVTGEAKWNRAVSTLFGYEPEQVGKGAEWWYEHIHPDDRERVVSSIHEVIDHGGSSWRDEYRFLKADGSYASVLDRGYAIYDDAGKTTRMVGAMLDLTERKRIEEEVRSNAERYRTLFESMDEGFCIVEMEFDSEDLPFDYRVIEMNPAFEEHTGLRGVVGKSIRACVPSLDEFWYQTYGRVALTGETVRFVSEEKALGDRWFDVSASRLGGPESRKVAILFNDITARKLAELERERLLREVETERERLAEVFQWAPSFMCVLRGPEHVFERANDRYLQLVGRQDLIGKTVRVALPEVEGQGYFEALDSVYRTGEAITGSDVHVFLGREPGRPTERRFVDFVYQPLRDSRGDVAGVLVQGVDITERKLAEAEVRRKTERVNWLVENTKDYAVVITDPEGVILEWQGGAERITGYAADEAVGRKAHLIFTPEDRAEGRPEYEMGRATETGRSEDKRWHIRKDGSRFFADGVMNALYDEGEKLRGFGKVFKDATAEKHAAEAAKKRTSQLQTLADIANRINSAHDVGSVVGVVTEEVRNLIGVHRAAMSLTPLPNHPNPVFATSNSGKYADDPGPPDVDTLKPFESFGPGSEPVRIARAERAEHPEWRTFREASGGGVFTNGWLAVPLVGRNGKSIGFIQLSDKHEGDFTTDDEAILVQLSQLVAIAVQNARLYQELRSNDERKDEFLAMLAHELRNPLAAISNAVRLSARTDLREHREWSMDVITRQMLHLSRLIDDLMDVSRITRGKIELRREVLDATPILESAAATVKTLVDERKHTLDIEIGEGPLWVNVDPTRLEQVVVNLLNNAAKYSENSGHIRLSARRDGHQAVVSIKDRGVGISPEKLPEMFELFAQGDRSLARSEGGLGIGLTVVKKLVEMHGGTITATSEGVGRGSEFVIRLPLAEKVKSESSASGESEAVPVKKARILVVDDNVDTARGMEKLLQLMGHEVAMVHSGPEAIASAMGHRPDFILLDIGLPGMSGYEVASRLRREDCCREAVIVAISGYGQDEDRRRSKESGFDHHLTKPLDLDALLSLLEAGGV